MLRKPSINELKDTLLDETFNVEPIDNSKNVIRKLLCVLTLAAIFMSIEITGGILSHSIAILSDAAHMFSDLLGFVISIISVYISGLPASKKHSYGYHRAGVIGALASVVVIWALTAFFIYYAVERIININQVEVEGKLMFGIACFGLITNLIMIKILHSDGRHSHGGSDTHVHIFKRNTRNIQDYEEYEYAVPNQRDDIQDQEYNKLHKFENDSLGTISQTASIHEEIPVNGTVTFNSLKLLH